MSESSSFTAFTMTPELAKSSLLAPAMARGALLAMVLAGCGDDASSSGDGGGGSASSSTTSESATTSATSTGATTTAGPGGGATSSNATSTGSTGEGGAGGSQGAGGGGGTGETSGQVVLLNRADTYRVHADFATFTPLPGAVVAESDACTLRLIGNPSQDVELHAAGTISLTGTTTPLSLEFDGEGYEQVGDGAIFEPEATIQVSATGDDVPPFSAELVAPSHAALTSPESFEYFTIDTSSDFVLEWASEGSVGDVELTVFASKEAPSEAFVLTCRFPLGDGVGVVPREVLENLTGALGESAFISEVARTTTEAGPWTVATLASALLDDSNGGVGFPELQ